MTTQLRSERHSISSLKIHLVCVTKYIRAVFTFESLELIGKSFKEGAKKMDFQTLEFNRESDHIHALIEYPPKLSVSQMVNALKGVSSRRYGQARYPKPYGKDALWSPSYFARAPLEAHRLKSLSSTFGSKKIVNEGRGFRPIVLIRAIALEFQNLEH